MQVLLKEGIHGPFFERTGIGNGIGIRIGILLETKQHLISIVPYQAPVVVATTANGSGTGSQSGQHRDRCGQFRKLGFDD